VVVEGGTHREQVLVRKDLTLRGTDDATVAPPSGDLGTLSGLRPLVGAGGRVRDVTVERIDFGGYVTEGPDEDGSVAVGISGCRFEELGADPLPFAWQGTTGRVFDTGFAGTPGTAQRALTAANGARVVAERNELLAFHSAGEGIGIGFFAFDSADNTLRDNEFEAVQYPAYLLAHAGSDAGSSAGRSRIVGNEAEGEDLPDDSTSYGTVVSAYDPEEADDTTETADDVKVVNNAYEGFDVGVGVLTEGEGVARNTKVVDNELEDVDEPVVDEGEGDEKADQRGRLTRVGGPARPRQASRRSRSPCPQMAAAEAWSACLTSAASTVAGSTFVTPVWLTVIATISGGRPTLPATYTP